MFKIYAIITSKIYIAIIRSASTLQLVDPVQIKGTTVEEFIASAQDRTRNALATSMNAAFGAFVEQLKSDQIAFDSDKILYFGSNLISM